MSRIRSLELIFNLEKNNFKSAADCAVAALHCLVINENLVCVGTGDEWPESDTGTTTELLPKGWNDDQDVYSLRYTSKDRKSHVLLKIAKADHMLLVNVVMNEDSIATMSFPVANYVSDNYDEYVTAYKDLESLIESFRKEIMEKLTPKLKNPSSGQAKKPPVVGNVTTPSPPIRPSPDLRHERPQPRFSFPRIGGSDLDPFGGGGGGMLMDPSSFGIPSRPTLPQFGVGGPGGLPRGAVPPGARFDPFMPPIRPNRFDPDPDHFRPPDFDDFI